MNDERPTRRRFLRGAALLLAAGALPPAADVTGYGFGSAAPALDPPAEIPARAAQLVRVEHLAEDEAETVKVIASVIATYLTDAQVAAALTHAGARRGSLDRHEAYDLLRSASERRQPQVAPGAELPPERRIVGVLAAVALVEGFTADEFAYLHALNRRRVRHGPPDPAA